MRGSERVRSGRTHLGCEIEVMVPSTVTGNFGSGKDLEEKLMKTKRQ